MSWSEKWDEGELFRAEFPSMDGRNVLYGQILSQMDPWVVVTAVSLTLRALTVKFFRGTCENSRENLGSVDIRK